VVAVVGLGELHRRLGYELGYRGADAGAGRKLEQLGAAELQGGGVLGADRRAGVGARRRLAALRVPDDDLAGLEQPLIGARPRRGRCQRAREDRNDEDPLDGLASLPNVPRSALILELLSPEGAIRVGPSRTPGGR
jgi:hypothetical protein